MMCPNCYKNELIVKEEKFLLEGVNRVIELKALFIFCPECGYENKRVIA